MQREWIERRLRWTRRLAVQAARQLLHLYAERIRSDVEESFQWKADRHPVTPADRMLEEWIIARIREADPRAQILTEERGLIGPARSVRRWLVDPLDGTVNFMHRYPHFAISIALEVRGTIVLGVVVDPTRKECFWAGRGIGAYCNRRPIRVSRVRAVNEALIATGFAYSVIDHMADVIQIFRGFLYTAMGIRRSGAAALDLCYVAAGRLDGFWEAQLNPWDVAAGVCILEEAGGRWTDFQNRSTTIYDREIVASNGHIHDQMIEIIQWARSGHPQ